MPRESIRTREYCTHGVQRFEISLTSVKRDTAVSVEFRINHNVCIEISKVFVASQYLQLNQIDTIN